MAATLAALPLDASTDKCRHDIQLCLTPGPLVCSYRNFKLDCLNFAYTMLNRGKGLGDRWNYTSFECLILSIFYRTDDVENRLRNESSELHGIGVKGLKPSSARRAAWSVHLLHGPTVGKAGVW